MLLFLQFGSFLSTCVGFYVLLKYYLLCGCAYVRQDHLFRRLLPQFCNAMDTRALIQKAAAVVFQCHKYQNTYSEGCCHSFIGLWILQQSTYSEGCCNSFIAPCILEHFFRRLLPEFCNAIDTIEHLIRRLLMQFCNAIDTRALIQKAAAVVLQCHGYQSTYSEGC